MARRKLLASESREALDRLKARLMSKQIGRPVSSEEVKFEAAKKVGVPLSRGYNGNLKTKNAGKVGGEIGGQMVKEMVRIAQERLTHPTRPD